MIIAIDFDGTIVEHEYPRIGTPIYGAIETMQKLLENDHKIILYTMRSGDELDEAMAYLFSHHIVLYGVNNNPNQIKWTSSPKAYAQLYIDDAALGCPLVKPLHKRPYVDWEVVAEKLLKLGLIGV